MIVPELSASARPDIELALRKRRRDLSFGCFIVMFLVNVLIHPETYGAEYLEVEANLLDEDVEGGYGLLCSGLLQSLSLGTRGTEGMQSSIYESDLVSTADGF